jgi:cation transport ATPase
MLTGDSQRTADAVARSLGIDVTIGEVLRRTRQST